MLKRLVSLSVIAGLCLMSSIAAARDLKPVDPVRAMISRDGEGAIVRYRLPAAVQRFVFADKDTIRDLWRVTTPGLTLGDGAVTGDRPFDAFDVHIRPDAAEVDRVYMGLNRVGRGHVIHGPSLKGEGVLTVLSFDLAGDETSLPERNAIDGYVYIGPAAQIVADARGDGVVGSNVAPELATLIRDAFFASLAFYQTRLDVTLPFKPVLIASVDSPGPASFRGDVTDTGVISVRFRGDAWRDLVGEVNPFIWHETFHLWNGHTVKARDENDAPWLHEGGAEYAATVGAVSTGTMTEEDARAGLARRVNNCRRVLGARDFDPARLRSGSAPYDCGVVIQWLADLELRKAGTGDVFALWQRMLSAAHGDPRGYGVAEFRALLPSNSAVGALLDSPGSMRWAMVRSRLADLGVNVENRPGDEDLMVSALIHVARVNCRAGPVGFSDAGAALRLDDGDCGPLSGAPLIVTVEDFDPRTQGRAMFEAVQTRCASSLPVRYRTSDDRLLEAACDKPLALPEVWQVADSPPLKLL